MQRLVIFAVMGAFCGSVIAGPLASDVNAYSDPNGIVWRGSAAISSGDGGLTATIDYSVYAPGVYPGDANLPTSGEFLYAYQIYVTGVAPMSSYTVGLLSSNEANNDNHDPTYGDPAGQVPDSSSFAGVPIDQVTWAWDPNDMVLTGEHSDVLLYSSVNAPRWFIGTVQDSGKAGSGLVPSPSDVIPEPATLSLLALGAVAVIRRRRMRK